MTAATALLSAAAAYFTCPSCGKALLPAPAANALKCAGGHVVNRAKEGHIHLLPPKRSRQSDEIDEMIRSERAFYEGGGFATQLKALASEVVRALTLCPTSDGAALSVLAPGCGEGAHLRAVEAEAARAGREVSLWGVDERKLAARYAAKRQPRAQVAVAAPHRLPFADGSMDVVFTAGLAAPWSECCRVLRPGGAVVMARAGPDHLRELRKHANDSPPPARTPKQFAAGLAEHYARIVTVERHGTEMTKHLRGMIPFMRDGMARGDRPQMASESETRVTVDMMISTHRVWLGTGGEPI